MGIKGISKYAGRFKEGDVFGEWVVSSKDIIIDGEAKLSCKCSCGVERVVAISTLMSGKSKSCYPCSVKNKFGSNNPSWKGFGEIPASKFRHIKLEEERKALSETWAAARGICALTGWEISISGGTASPDRIDSTKGYSADNIQWVSKNANVCKNLFELDYFVTLCHAVSTNLPNPNVKETKQVFGR